MATKEDLKRREEKQEREKNQSLCGLTDTSKMSTIERTRRAARARASLSKLPQLMFAVIPILIISILPQASQQQQQSGQHKSHFSRQAPVITPFAFRQNVQENQRSSVLCAVSDGDLPVEISWLKDGQLLTPQLAQAKRIIIKPEAEQSTLQIVPVRFDHAGNYTCVAKNKAGAQAHSTLLTVHGVISSIISNPQTGNLRRLTKRHDADMILDDSGQPHHEPLMLDTQLDSGGLLEGQAEGGASENQNHHHHQQQQQLQQRGKQTLYACEEKQLEIKCQPGESIQLIRANYGRFSIQICNEHGQLEWKVNCMSPASFQIITNSCQAKQSCQLLASNTIFGDSCPGTHKYLEVHYQCVDNESTNRTMGDTGRQQQQAGRSPQTTALRLPRPNVITLQPPQQEISSSGGPGTTSISTITTSESRQPANTPMLRWPEAARASQPALPSWMGEVPLNGLAASGATTTTAAAAAGVGQPPNSPLPPPAPHFCPETVWRQIRWPASEPKSLVQMPCPAHAHPSSPLAPLAASFACLPSGQWAQRVQAARCQSIWLRNLSKSLEVGDSPLSILAELALRTRPASPLAGLMMASGAGNMWSSSGSYEASQPSTTNSLFGDDLIQIGRIVRTLVDQMGEFLTNGIHDDKQRSGFAREILQSLVELINNLAHEQHLDAWLDLLPTAGERQRPAGQLLQSLEGAAALLAYHQQQQQQQAADRSDHEFLKVTDNVYVAIRTLALSSQQQQQQQQASNRTLEVSFPSETSLLGTKWMSSEQKFTLHLQTALGSSNGNGNPDQSAQVDVKYSADEQQQVTFSPGGQSLKIVFVMLRGLGAQMEPPASAAAAAETGANRVIVNSNLVSLSIVPDSRYKFAPLKVHLSAPIELIFRHLEQQAGPQMDGQTRRNNSHRCVFWDTAVSDWLSDGCKLIATNRTHSSCACDHLTSFALLTELDEQSALFDGSGQNQQQQQQPHRNEQPKVQLDSVENEIFLANKMLYLAKLLDGLLFGFEYQQQQQQVGNSSASGRLIIYISCLFSGALLALNLAAAAYSRAHARRLLGAIPAHPPPPLLVSSGRPLQQQQQRPSSSLNSDSSPTYSSDYSAALAATKTKLEAEAEAYDSRLTSPSSSSKQLQVGAGRSSQACQLQVPIRLVAQLLALQLLLVLMVESQNYLSAQRHSQRQLHQAAALALGSLDPMQFMEPIGSITWLLVGVLYYLVAATTCWLAAQLVQLNLELLPAVTACGSQALHSALAAGSGGSSASSSGGSVKSSAAHYTNSSATNSSQLIGGAGAHHQHQVSGSMFGRQVSGSNLYGAPGGCFSQAAPAAVSVGLRSASSPSSSFSSAADQHTALGRLEDSARLYGTTPALGSGSAAQAHLGLAASGRCRLLAFVEHALPLLLVALVGWLSAGAGRSLNSIAFTSSFWAQVAHWPLLVDASLAAFSLLLYCGPALCLLLLIVALLLVRGAPVSPNGGGGLDNPRGIPPKQVAGTGNLVNPYGSSHLAAGNAHELGSAHQLVANHFLSAGAEQQQQQQHQRQHQHQHQRATATLSKQSKPNDNKANRSSPMLVDPKGAKFLCITLLGLLALHSISWISFFGHISQALNSPQSNYNLVYAFAVSNLALVLLLCWSQRRTFRRAAQLAGLVRLLGRCVCSGSSARQRARFYRNQQQPAGKSSVPSASSGVKVSPDGGQSLFIVSQAARQPQYGTSYHCGPSYSSGQQLYQQHIYESATQLNEQQHRLNMMQLIQQQQQQQQQLHQMHQLDQGQQQQQQQQHNHLSLNRSLSSLQHLNGSRHYNGLENQQQQQQQQQQRQHMTMKPPMSVMHPMMAPGQRHSAGEQQQSAESSGQLLVLEPPSHLKQQQQFVCSNQQQQQSGHLGGADQRHSQGPSRQLPGEADGPLVAFSSSTSSSISQPPATFGPSTSLASSAAQNPILCSTMQQQQKEHQQRLTEHQLFSRQQQQQQDQQQQSSSPINCISDQFQRQSERCSTSVADANQHQYYSINSSSNNNNNNNNSGSGHKPQANYADALKLAMIQQQQQNESSVSHHFRRTSSRQATSGTEQSHQLAMIDRNSCVGGASGNIYDVANFALGHQ